MQDIRCGKCGKKLAEADYNRLAIKCCRCKTVNHYGHEPLNPERQSAPGNQKHEYQKSARQERV